MGREVDSTTQASSSSLERSWRTCPLTTQQVRKAFERELRKWQGSDTKPDFRIFTTSAEAQAFLDTLEDTLSRTFKALRIHADTSDQGPGKSTEPHKASKFYVVKTGFGVEERFLYTSLAECRANVTGIDDNGYWPICKEFSTRGSAQAWLNGVLPRGAQVDSKLPESLRWDGDLTSMLPHHRAGYFIGPTSLATAFNARLHDSFLLRLEQIRAQGFTTTWDGALVVYIDGTGGRKRGIGCGVWWGDHGEAHASGLSERVPGTSYTNLRAKLMEIIRALEICPYPNLPLEIRTDSMRSIECVYSVLPKWLSTGILDSDDESIEDQDLIIHLLTLLSQRQLDIGVRLKYVRAHPEEVGNPGARRLANEGQKKSPVPDRTGWFTMKDFKRYQCRTTSRAATDETSEESSVESSGSSDSSDTESD